MSEPFVGEIRMFAGNFAPRGWAFCDGQLLAVSENDVLFSLLGTIYGGDGRTTFALPDLRGRIPVHAGTGPGLSTRRLGERAGQETVTLNANTLPPHAHGCFASTDAASDTSPANNVLAASAAGNIYANAGGGDVSLHASAITAAGGSQAHANVMPYVCINYIIALFGIYPSRS